MNKTIQPKTQKDNNEEWKFEAIQVWKLQNGEHEPPEWFLNFIKSVIQQTEERCREEKAEEIKKYPHLCGACESKISNWSHTLACRMRKSLIESL